MKTNMGLDIGYTLYEKEPFDLDRVLIRAHLSSYEEDERWSCGRCNINYCWGDLFDYKSDNLVTPVFQDKLDKYTSTEENYTETYQLMSFNDFKRHILSAVQEVYEAANKEKSDILKTLERRAEEIAELRKCQQQCTSVQGYAFDKWSAEIAELREANTELSEYYDNYDNENYDYCKAKKLESMIRLMEQDLAEDKYYIVPFFSD